MMIVITCFVHVHYVRILLFKKILIHCCFSVYYQYIHNHHHVHSTTEEKKLASFIHETP